MKLAKELNRLIKKSMKFVGADKDFICFDYIEVALDHAIWLRKENNKLYKQVNSLSKKIKKETKCPYPIKGDNGTAQDCIKKGHCACTEGDK